MGRRDIAADLGISTGTLTSHFPQTQEILQAIMEQNFHVTAVREEITTLNQFQVLLDKMLESLEVNAFYFRDPSIFPLNDQGSQDVAGLFGILTGALEYLQEAELFSSALSTERREDLARMLMLSHLGWIQQSDTFSPVQSMDRARFLRAHWTLMEPYRPGRGGVALRGDFAPFWGLSTGAALVMRGGAFPTFYLLLYRGVITGSDLLAGCLDHIEVVRGAGQGGARDRIGHRPHAVLVLHNVPAVGSVIIIDAVVIDVVFDELDVAGEGDGAGPEAHAVADGFFGPDLHSGNTLPGGVQQLSSLLPVIMIPLAALLSGHVGDELLLLAVHLGGVADGAVGLRSGPGEAA